MTPELLFLALLGTSTVALMAGHWLGKRDGREGRRYLRDRVLDLEERLREMEERKSDDWWRG